MIYNYTNISDANAHAEKGNKDKTIIIIVNGQEVSVPAKPKEISYEQVVRIAYPQYEENDQIIYTVSYSKGPSENQKGTLVKGQTVKLKKGMIFNVGCSSRS
ncbi:MAG: multiubiquitin domain-containing protein [Eubacterium sp.]|nr:multiubiquitin domain-containing protein [Eubacterium sp.]